MTSDEATLTVNEVTYSADQQPAAVWIWTEQDSFGMFDDPENPAYEMINIESRLDGIPAGVELHYRWFKEAAGIGFLEIGDARSNLTDDIESADFESATCVRYMLKVIDTAVDCMRTGQLSLYQGSQREGIGRICRPLRIVDKPLIDQCIAALRCRKDINGIRSVCPVFTVQILLNGNRNVVDIQNGSL